MIGGNPGPEFLQALHAAGAVGGPARTLPEEADILFYDPAGNPLAKAAPETLEKMKRLLGKGGSVVFLMSGRTGDLEAFETLMPVTLWAAQAERHLRLSTGGTVPAGAPARLASALRTPGFQLPGRYDLHLPYSTMEGGQHRYEWERLGKPLVNTDWRLLLAGDRDGLLPLLVEGRYGPGRVFVFAGDLYAPGLAAWPGYGAFVGALLDEARPRPLPASAAEADGVTVAIPAWQASGSLAVEVTNGTASAFNGVLFCKVRNFSRELMNSVSIEVSVPAGKTVQVAVPESAAAPEREIAAASPAADAAPFRRIDAGLSGLDRQKVVSVVSGLVDCTPALTLSVQGEDVRAFPEKDHWMAGGNNFLSGNGMPLGRSFAFCGERPKLSIRFGNGFHNIAPLAVATDLAWPENVSAQGLNDGSYSYESVRGKLPVTGYWAGRSAEAQKIRLAWPAPVTVARQALSAQTPYRGWDRANPPRYALAAEVPGGEKLLSLASVDPAVYVSGRREDSFPPVVASACVLTVSGLDAKANLEPRALQGGTFNCALGEWELYGWPDRNLPPSVKGKLTVTVRDLSAGTVKTLLEKTLFLDAAAETALTVELPTLDRYGQVAVHGEFVPDDGGAPVATDFPFLFIPPDVPHLLARSTLGEAEAGMLCSPGFLVGDEFGLGTLDDTQGWGGPDDQPWAWQNDLVEMGSRPRDSAGRFFLSSAGISHYTDPWRSFPSGRPVWDWMTDGLLAKFASGPWKGKTSIHIGLSDRWNGVPIGAAFSWDDLVRFDQSLRAAGKPGLQGRTKAELCDDVTSHHADAFQRFELATYSDALLRSQERFARAGIRMTTETHGSFPLAGGDLGSALAKTGNSVGTDLFWDLHDEDLYKSLGYRFGLVAANPDLESGAYGQWGWISGSLANPTWFAPSGDAEPSRRQWYATYWMGRITSDGTYRPYTVYGFSLQGGYGVKNTMADWDAFNRVENEMIWTRPEKAVGFGLVVSWQLQENRMGAEAGYLGFGLYAAKQYGQLDATAGEAYHRLVRNGVPFGFVASTHTLRKWNGTQPLLVVDGFDTDPWEIAELERLNKAGAPIVAVGSEGRAGHREAEAFFGVRRTEGGWTAVDGTEVVPDAAGRPFAYLRRRSGAGPTLFCPKPVASIDGAESALLAALCLKAADQPLSLTPGLTVTPFAANGSLFLLLGSQRDDAVLAEVGVRPSLLDPSFKGTAFRVIDHDRGVVVPAQWDAAQGTLRFRVPCAGNDGRMLQIIPSS
ncbi:hypothetical protein [Verrucomicrobium sp. GAS474]|uniref:hypothetical protein n=1 Tax=Verrucomicrobium sp. GAS474 TaxID=1882831 RepID=UPI00138FF8B1|nr:hypothetical protein [Verrucomicrobium sp. GAS474]